MLSAEAMSALSGLDHGAQYNTTHSTARELMAAGLACDDWGHLNLTEAGRVYLRRGARRILISNDDDHVYDMSVNAMQIPPGMQIDRTPLPYWTNSAVDIDPMASPQHVFKHKVIENTPVVFAEPPPEPLPIAATRKQEMLRAAGVASGITGVWPDEQWVIEFIRALDGGSDGGTGRGNGDQHSAGAAGARSADADGG